MLTSSPFTINNYKEEVKDTFYVLKQNKWIEINFNDIKKNDTIVKKSCKNCYFSVVESSKFYSELNDFAIIVENLQKFDVEFDWINEEIAVEEKLEWMNS